MRCEGSIIKSLKTLRNTPLINAHFRTFTLQSFSGRVSAMRFPCLQENCENTFSTANFHAYFTLICILVLLVAAAAERKPPFVPSHCRAAVCPVRPARSLTAVSQRPPRHHRTRLRHCPHHPHPHPRPRPISLSMPPITIRSVATDTASNRVSRSTGSASAPRPRRLRLRPRHRRLRPRPMPKNLRNKNLRQRPRPHPHLLLRRLVSTRCRPRCFRC